MSKVFEKLNLKDQRTISVLNGPDSFKAELASLRDVTVINALDGEAAPEFVLAFATRQAEVDELSRAVARKTKGDAIVWFAYPKGTSRKYTCEFNRDTGWAVLKKLGFNTVRQVAIDELDRAPVSPGGIHQVAALNLIPTDDLCELIRSRFPAFSAGGPAIRVRQPS
ncbi:MAG: hypothetical protein ACTHJG_04260 [Rhodanobacteraceae bacterium]